MAKPSSAQRNFVRQLSQVEKGIISLQSLLTARGKNSPKGPGLPEHRLGLLSREWHRDKRRPKAESMGKHL
jgi:hypothetical protein